MSALTAGSATSQSVKRGERVSKNLMQGGRRDDFVLAKRENPDKHLLEHQPNTNSCKASTNKITINKPKSKMKMKKS